MSDESTILYSHECDICFRVFYDDIDRNGTKLCDFCTEKQATPYTERERVERILDVMTCARVKSLPKALKVIVKYLLDCIDK